MNETGDFVVGGKLEDLEDFFAGRGWHISYAKADAERALLESASDGFEHLLFFCIGQAMANGFVSGQERAAVMRDGHAHRNMSDGCAEIDERPAFAPGIPLGDGRSSDFEFE